MRQTHSLCRAANGSDLATVVRVTWVLARVQCHPEASLVVRASMSRKKAAPSVCLKGSSGDKMNGRGWPWGSEEGPSESLSNVLGGPGMNTWYLS